MFFDGTALAEVEERRERLASWEWRFGKTPQFDFETDKRFSFGDTQIYFNLRDGVIRETKVYSDCLDNVGHGRRHEPRLDPANRHAGERLQRARERLRRGLHR